MVPQIILFSTIVLAPALNLIRTACAGSSVPIQLHLRTESVYEWLPTWLELLGVPATPCISSRADVGELQRIKLR